MKEDFLKQGYSKLERLIEEDEVVKLRGIYDALLADKVKTAGLRSDLAGGAEEKPVEKITQIMRPSLVEPELSNTETYKVALKKACELLGDDMQLDFDMLINKAPHTDTETPKHQDAAYWIDMPDKRAVSCWIALDDVYEENGCMWFLPKESDVVMPHHSMPGGGALFCDADVTGAESVALKPGGCTFHDGFTLHFSKGNTTGSQRRALILNFRPKAMIEFERNQGVDHTGDRKVRQ